MERKSKSGISSRNFDVVMIMDAILISLACLLVVLAYREINDAPVRHAHEMADAMLTVADDFSRDDVFSDIPADGDGLLQFEKRLTEANKLITEVAPAAQYAIYSRHPVFAANSLEEDAFRAAALEKFQSGEISKLESLEYLGGAGFLRVAVPMQAFRDCRRCETLGYEPYQRGEVIGVRELVIPISDQQAQAMKKLLYACGLMASSLMVFLGVIIPMFKRGRKERAQIHDLAQSLEVQASTDPLTGLNNRRFFEKALQEYLNEFNDRQAPLGLLIFDLDHFKQVNDTYGHDAGDMVLKEVALRLRAITRENDVVARIGGEEFAVITPYATMDQLMGVAERYRAQIGGLKVDVGDTIIKPTISIGVATNSNGELFANDLFKAADAKLYEAKRNGRNRVAA